MPRSVSSSCGTLAAGLRDISAAFPWDPSLSQEKLCSCVVGSLFSCANPAHAQTFFVSGTRVMEALSKLLVRSWH